MAELRRIAFILDDFTVGMPGQHLLDRFLIGYPREREFHKIEKCEIVVRVEKESGSGDLAARTKDFGLQIAASREDAVRDTDGVVIGSVTNHDVVESVLQRMKPAGCCFVYGRLAGDRESAASLAKLAQSRGIALSSGTATSMAFRLPDIDLASEAKVREALIIVQGAPFEAEIEALEGLFPLLEKRRHGESGVRNIYPLKNQAMADALGGANPSFKRLLAAAVSRSNTIQGDPIKDGRTQDVVGLGLVPVLAKDPRGWVLEHLDGLRSTILVLDGVLADFNFSIALENGEIVSAQLYRPPAPMEGHFSRLAASLEGFFRRGEPPAPIQRGILIAELIDRMKRV